MHRMAKLVALTLSSVALMTAPLGSQETSGYQGSDAERNVTAASAAPDASLFKDARVAKRRALFYPGGGHFYAGESKRGAVFLGGAVGAIAIGAALSSSSKAGKYTHGDMCFYEPNGPGCESSSSDMLPLFIGLGAAAFSWVISYADADDAADRANAQNGLPVSALRFRPEPVVQSTSGDVRVGLQLRAAW